MDWDHLRVFLAVARSGQILSAARKLRLDHATVSRRLNALEADLGCKLFERSVSGCVLCPAGERLLPTAERVESEFLCIKSELAEHADEVEGIVRIGTPDGFGTFFLAPELAQLSEIAPGVTLQLVPLPKLFSVSKREVDIAITVEAPDDGRLLCQKLIDYRLCLYASRSYIESRKITGGGFNPKDHVVVTYPCDFFYSAQMQMFEEFAELCGGRYECASVGAQLEAVTAGAGIGILPTYATWKYPDLEIISDDYSFNRSYWMVFHTDARQMRHVSFVRDLILRRLKERRAIFSGHQQMGPGAGRPGLALAAP